MILLHQKEEARFFHTHVSIYLVGTLEDILVKRNLNNTNFKSTVKLRIKCYEFLYTHAFPGAGVPPSPHTGRLSNVPFALIQPFVIVHAKPVPAATPSTTFRACYSKSMGTEYISQSLFVFPSLDFSTSPPLAPQLQTPEVLSRKRSPGRWDILCVVGAHRMGFEHSQELIHPLRFVSYRHISFP